MCEVTMDKKIENALKWRKENILRYELTLNKEHDKVAYKQLKKISNKRAYLIKLIEEDAKNGSR